MLNFLSSTHVSSQFYLQLMFLFSVEGAQPSEVKIENSGTLAADDSSLVSLMGNNS